MNSNGGDHFDSPVISRPSSMGWMKPGCSPSWGRPRRSVVLQPSPDRGVEHHNVLPRERTFFDSLNMLLHRCSERPALDRRPFDLSLNVQTFAIINSIINCLWTEAEVPATAAD